MRLGPLHPGREGRGREWREGWGGRVGQGRGGEGEEISIHGLKLSAAHGSHDQGHAHVRVVLWATRRRGRPTSMYTKFEADCSIPSKVIKESQNLEIRSRHPGHAHLAVVL